MCSRYAFITQLTRCGPGAGGRLRVCRCGEGGLYCERPQEERVEGGLASAGGLGWFSWKLPQGM